MEKLQPKRHDLVISDIKVLGMDEIAWKKGLMMMDPTLGERIILITGDLLNPATEAFLEG